MMNSSVVNLKNATTLNTTTTTDPAAPGKTGANQELGKDAFLKLLLTQLSSQDPLDPTDSKDFIAQLSQFSSVEGITNMNKKMDDLITITGASNSANAVSLLGKEVKVAGNDIRGPISGFYELGQSAQSVTVEVRDDQGKIVKVLGDMPTGKGEHQMKLEGFPAGKYKVYVNARDAQGKEIKTAVAISEKVKAVNFTGSVPVLIMESGNQMKASDVLEIQQVPPVAAPQG